EQAIPFPGKRGLRTRVEQGAAERAAHEAERARLDLVYRVRKAYADLLLAQEALTLIADQRAATRDIEELTRSRYAVGLAGQADVLRAQAELARLEQMRFHQEGERTVAEAELNRLLARPAGTPAVATRRLSSLVPGTVAVPAREDVVARAESHSPDLA